MSDTHGTMKESQKQIDPRVVIPEEIRKVGSRADELQAAYIASLQEGGEQQQEGDEPELPGLPQPPAVQPQPEPEPQPAPQPQQRQRQPAPAPAQEDDADLETWKQRALSAQGRLRTQEENVKNLRTRLGNLEATIASMATPAPAAPEPPARFLTEEDKETYGDEFLGTMERQAREVIEPLRREFEHRIAQIDGNVRSVQTVVGKNAQERMIDHMNDAVPSWLQLNEDRDFIGWLNEEDLLTGRQRQAMLDEAWGRNDATRVAAFFNSYLREQAATTEPEPPRQNGQRKAPVVSLGQFAAPGKAKSGEPPAKVQAKPPITRQFISKFYTDVANGRYNGRDADKKQIEADIFAANAEGRIT